MTFKIFHALSHLFSLHTTHWSLGPFLSLMYVNPYLTYAGSYLHFTILSYCPDSQPVTMAIASLLYVFHTRLSKKVKVKYCIIWCICFLGSWLSHLFVFILFTAFYCSLFCLDYFTHILHSHKKEKKKKHSYTNSTHSKWVRPTSCETLVYQCEYTSVNLRYGFWHYRVTGVIGRLRKLRRETWSSLTK